MANDKQPGRKLRRLIGRWLAVGIANGSGLGVVMDNIAIEVGVGIALGVVLSWSSD